ncbi:hypothetical protein Misp04_25220 [Micromonospora sp. NBRC 101691]|nr:hypothetical protein Misp04_25220 [Micromonospora sp. NBRC 101691]
MACGAYGSTATVRVERPNQKTCPAGTSAFVLVIRLLSTGQARGADQSITIPSGWEGMLGGMPVTGGRDVSVFT